MRRGEVGKRMGEVGEREGGGRRVSFQKTVLLGKFIFHQNNFF